MQGLEMRALDQKCPRCGEDAILSFREEDAIFSCKEETASFILFENYGKIYKNLSHSNFVYLKEENHIEKYIKPFFNEIAFPFHCYQCESNFLLSKNISKYEDRAFLVYVLSHIIPYLIRSESEKYFQHLNSEPLIDTCRKHGVLGKVIFSLMEELNSDMYLLVQKLEHDRDEIKESLYHCYIPPIDVFMNIGINIFSGLITSYILWIMGEKKTKDPLSDDEIAKVVEKTVKHISQDDIDRAVRNTESKYYNQLDLNVRSIAEQEAIKARNEIKGLNIDDYC